MVLQASGSRKAAEVGGMLKEATSSRLRLPVGQIGKAPVSYRHNLGFYLLYSIISSDFFSS